MVTVDRLRSRDQTRLFMIPIHPAYLAELDEIWQKDKRLPTLESRKAWALARNLAPETINRFWHIRRQQAKRKQAKAKRTGTTRKNSGHYELPIGNPPDISNYGDVIVKSEPGSERESTIVGSDDSTSSGTTLLSSPEPEQLPIIVDNSMMTKADSDKGASKCICSLCDYSFQLEEKVDCADYAADSDVLSSLYPSYSVPHQSVSQMSQVDLPADPNTLWELSALPFEARSYDCFSYQSQFERDYWPFMLDGLVFSRDGTLLSPEECSLFTDLSNSFDPPFTWDDPFPSASV